MIKYKIQKINRAPISEIFFSIQGEGIFVGVPQVFVRFSGCNIKKCAFCDELTTKKSFKTVKEIITLIRNLSKKAKPHSVSLTGGEPLLYPQFLKELSHTLKREGYLIYLETNGTLPHNLKYVKRHLDFISMDIKLPSSTLTKAYFTKHRKFLKAASRKNIFVKVVITKKTNFSCFRKAVELVKKIDKKIPFVIQPATKAARVNQPHKDMILLFQAYALKFLKDVRVIPQMHKLIGVK
jgi:organic radical activating enzyme